MSEMTFEQVRHTDPTVYHMLEQGCSLEAVICALSEEKSAIMKSYVELYAISPKKMRVGDDVVVWHCPDDLVPIR